MVKCQATWMVLQNLKAGNSEGEDQDPRQDRHFAWWVIQDGQIFVMSKSCSSHGLEVLLFW